MRNVAEYEEINENESEITLNTGTLLGIFFGLVLVCGVFFGFGYSMGRRGTANTSSTPEASPTASPQAETSTPQANSTPKPSAMEALQTEGQSADPTNPSAAQSMSQEDTENTTPKPAPAQTLAQPSSVVRPALKPAAFPVATPASTPSSGSFMVQIAAVSRQEDANTLANALQKHGYTVSVRNEPQDKLYHVQVGPFASRDAARAMRSRLLADGYNAILKP